MPGSRPSTEGKKGRIAVGEPALLSADYFRVWEDGIQDMESVLTLLAGKPVFGVAEFTGLAPPPPPVLPEWSPVKTFGGYQARPPVQPRCSAEAVCGCGVA